VSKPKLLLADDSVTVQKVVSLTFADEGVDVITVGDGDSAIEAIRQSRPDIVLADVNMPGSSGYEVCRSVRESDSTRDIPVILLVGSFEPFDEGLAESVGANAFLTKPFQSIRLLVAQVSELLAAASMREKDDGLSAKPAAENVPHTEDIESLYQASVNAAGEEVGEPETLASFDEGTFDDEMIETSYVSVERAGELREFEFADTGEDSFADLSQSSDHVQTESGAEEKEMPAVSNSEGMGEFGPQIGATDVLPSPFDEPALDENASERLTEDLHDAHGAEPVSQIGIETVRLDESFAPGPAARVDLDPIDLLELPPPDLNATVEFTTVERSDLMGSNKQVVSISPELMEILVAKVVEKLSEKY
jgi:CheY-like chemotaxis protein